MSNQRKRRLPDDAERLFGRIALLPQGTHDLDRLHKELGFPTPQEVSKAIDLILQYAHQDGWCHPAIYVENNELFCGPNVCKSWNGYSC